MARTRASVGAKISSGKSSKARSTYAPAATTGGSTGASKKASRSAGGGNPVCPRETPKWQRPISTFFVRKQDSRAKEDGDVDDSAAVGSSKSKPKRYIIESDEEPSPEKPKNSELDETLELETLTGDNSHKIEEYYPKGAKGKGVGKKTKGTKNAEDSESDTEDQTEGDKSQKENIRNNQENNELKSPRTKANKINIESTTEIEDKIDENDKDSGVKGRKRDRQDRTDESASKKIKVD